MKQEPFRHRIVISVLVFFIGFGTLIGCGIVQEADPDEAIPNEQETDEPDEEARTPTDYPIVIPDDWDLNVSIESRPERVVSLSPGHTDILLALNVEDALVGLDRSSALPKALTSIVRVGTLDDLDHDALDGLRPDLVLANDQTPALLNWQAKSETDLLIRNPDSLEELCRTIEEFGEVMDAAARAEVVVSKMREKLATIRRDLDALDSAERPRVFVEMWSDPLMTAGGGAFIDDVIRAAGGINVAGDKPGVWVAYSEAALQAEDPDAIITVFQETVSEIESGKRPSWQSLSAIEAARYRWIDLDLVNYPSPRAVEGVSELFDFFHGER